MAHDGEVDVEQHELDPVAAEARGERQGWRLEDVEVDADGEVGRHRQQVSDRQPRQDHVCR